MSVHCVQAFGALVDLFKEIKRDLLLSKDDEKKRGLMFPPKIMLHSFSGSAEIAKALKAQTSFSSKEFKFVTNNLSVDASEKLRPGCLESGARSFSPPSLFFSLSELVNMRSEKKLEKLLSSIPIESVLLESDCGSVHLVDKKLQAIASKCADALDLDLQSFLDQVSENNVRFFN